MDVTVRSHRKFSLTPVGGPDDLDEFFRGYVVREKRRRQATAKVSVSHVDVPSTNNLMVVLVFIFGVFLVVLTLSKYVLS